MAFRALCVALLLSVLPVAGCGTAANLVRQGPESGWVTPFGGVKQDMWCLQKAANGEVGVKTPPKAGSEQYPQVALMLFCAVDLPLSLIGDVVTWPYTATYTYINQPTLKTPPVLISPPVPSAQPVIVTQPAPPIPPVPQALAEGQPQAAP